MKPTHLRDHVIRPALHLLASYNPMMNTPASINLLIGIALAESNCGEYVYQVGGPAIGPYQMQPKTHDDIYQNYLNHKLALKSFVLTSVTGYGLTDRHSEMAYNWLYATVMARVHLWRVREPLPDHNDLWALGAYWKIHWNTDSGRGDVEDFVEGLRAYLGNRG